MKKLVYVLSLLIIASMVLTACGGGAPATQPPAATDEPAATEPAATDEPAATEPAATDEPGATEAPAATPTLTPYPVAECEGGKVCIRWFVGLGTGTDAPQIETQEEVVADFNASQDRI
ncbi:MAG TPA: hypothetical protein VJ830_05950, partial [Anaerolineales bacterium]|nr:hypothetical protein [Anaerolineales bacterium]